MIRVASGAVALSLVAILAWALATGGAWRGSVSVVEAEEWLDGVLRVAADTWEGNPEVVRLNETDEAVEVEVVSTRRFFSGSGDCFDLVVVDLQDPLDTRALLDLHSGLLIEVTEVDAPFPGTLGD